MPKTAKKKISNLVSKIRSKLKRKRNRKVAPRRTRTPRRTTTERMFGISQSRLMGPNTPGSVKTPSPETRKSPNSVTPNLVPLSQRSPGVKSLKTPVQQSASPLSIRFTNSGPGGMGPNLKDIRDCHLINNEQKCSSNEKCKWNQEEQKCHLKPIPFNLTN